MRLRRVSPVYWSALSVGLGILAAFWWARGEPTRKEQAATPRPPRRPAAALLARAGEGKALGAHQLPPGIAYPEYRARDPAEWQGMLIDVTATPPCEQSSDCGLARACVGQKCVGCTSDRECAGGEVCVLDHCVLQALASCRRAAECGESGPCVLSGYSPDERSNGDMRSYCVQTRREAPKHVQPPPEAYVSGPSPWKRLYDRVKAEPPTP